MTSKKPHKDCRQVADLIRDERWGAVGTALAEMHAADIADALDLAPRDKVAQAFSLVDDDVKPDVLAEIESAASTELLESLSNSELSDIVEDMAPDDAADVLAELPEHRSEQVLELMEEEESEDVRKLLTYDDDTAGGIMTTDVVAMQGDQTVREALDAIASMDAHEPFYNANIVGAKGRLIGYVDVWDLLRERNRSRPIGDLAKEHMAVARVDMDQEEVAQLMAKYDLHVLPVVDRAGILVGRVMTDDIIDVMEEEASEDIFRLAGSDDAELDSTSALKSSMVRLPWLVITLTGGFITSMILKQFHHHFHDMLVLAAFVPVILAMGGNTGIQSSTLVVRSLALGTLRGQNLGRLLLRELAAGAMMGVFCGTVIGAWAHFMISGALPEASPMNLSIVVGLALFSAMTFASLFGATVPLILDRLKIDPAVASGPFVTITNDISALLIYFGVAIALLEILPL